MRTNKSNTKEPLISRRAFIIGISKFFFLLLLVGRMFYMQFIKKHEYEKLSNQNRIKIIILPPNRGQIYDRHMQLIAENEVSFKLLLDKTKNSSLCFKNEITYVTRMLQLNSNQTEDINNRIEKAKRKTIIVIIDSLTWHQVSIIEEHKELLQSLLIQKVNSRIYKYAHNTAHLLGYTRKNGKNIFDLIELKFTLGKTGIEEFYQQTLRGHLGYKQVEINAYGKYVRELSRSNPTSGNNLYLNIDAELQNQVTSYLDPKGCSVIVMDCEDGSILLATCTPSYNPNSFNSLSKKYWSELIENPYKPLINKIIYGIYPPGSVFKIITALAALEAGITPQHKINCHGGPALGKNSFRCGKRIGHGVLNMHDAIKYSCNIYMFEIAKIIGPHKIVHLAQKFGFGSNTGIDLPYESIGILPLSEWKKKGSKWSLGDTLNLSIGQGFLLCTPIQLARFITAIATDGKLYTPRIAKSKPEYTQLVLEKDHVAFIKEALYSAVNTVGGTGYAGRLNHSILHMSGKTGTAQVIAKKNINDDLNRSSIIWKQRNHAIFAGYLPSHNPKYSIVVYYDHGGGGANSAAPIAKSIAEKLLEKYTS